MEQNVPSCPCLIGALNLEEFSPELVRLHVKSYLCNLQLRFDEQLQSIKEGLLEVSAGVVNEDDCPSYGITGPVKPTAESRLSAPRESKASVESISESQYLRQRQIMAAMQFSRRMGSTADVNDSEDEEEEEDADGNPIVYECPGLAPTGEMEVWNPLFQDEFLMSSDSSCAASSDDKTNTGGE